MSVATKSYGQSFTETQASSISAAAQRSPSPPTSVPMSTQVSQQPSMTATTSFPTPDNNVIGQTRKAPEEFDEEHITKRQRIDDQTTTTQIKSGHELESPTSTHWQTELGSQTSDQQLAASGSISAVRTLSQRAESEATQPAPVELSLEQLQKNVGDVFHLCKSGKIPLLCH